MAQSEITERQSYWRDHVLAAKASANLHSLVEFELIRLLNQP